MNEYVQEKIGFMPNFTQWIAHFRRGRPPDGNQFRSALLRALWNLFPHPNKRLGSDKGKTLIGYYFATLLRPEQHRGWFGFVPSGSIIDGPNRGNEAELIVATTFDVEGLSDHAFVAVNVPAILGPGVPCHTWIINFDKEWSTPGIWREKLNPFGNRVESIVLQLKDRDVSEVQGEAS